MTCHEFRNLLVYLVFGELPRKQRLRVDDHLSQCIGCAAEWADYQQVIRLARQLPRDPLPASLQDQLQALLAKAHQVPARADTPSG
jgi:anti-sigma factor RsiW